MSFLSPPTGIFTAAPYPFKGSGFLLVSIVESQLVEGVCLGDRQPFLHLPQPREFSHSGMDVSRCQWENWTYREFSGSSVSNLFWAKSEEFRNLQGNDVGSLFPQVFSSGQLSQSYLHDHSHLSSKTSQLGVWAIRLAGVGPECC